MARWKPNCIITRNFAFGNKQYKKGTETYLSGEAKDFAALNRLATMLEPDNPAVVPVAVIGQAGAIAVEGSDV